MDIRRDFLPNLVSTVLDPLLQPPIFSDYGITPTRPLLGAKRDRDWDWDILPSQIPRTYQEDLPWNVRWRPRCDILEVDNTVRVEFELPGIHVDNISLTANEGVLILSTRKNPSHKEERGSYFQRERHFGDFYRKVVLPDYVDTSKVDAVLEEGVLKVVMPMKDTMGDQTKMIPISARAK